MNKPILGLTIMLFSSHLFASSEAEKQICAQTLILAHDGYQVMDVQAKPFGGDALICAGIGNVVTRTDTATTLKRNEQKFALVFPRTMKFTALTKEQITMLSEIRFSEPEVFTIGNDFKKLNEAPRDDLAW